MNIKKFLSFVLALVIVVCCSACSSQLNNNVPKSDGGTAAAPLEKNVGVKIKLDGKDKYIVAYNINGNNYFKLRDIANLLKGTQAEFDVVWNDDKQAIEMISGKPYSTNEPLTNEILKNPIATSSYVDIYKDGAIVLLGAYNIADNNYFKLRDVAAAIDFNVGWDSEEEVIEINTNKSYEYPTSDSFGLNTQYLSYLGKTKAEVDDKLGFGRYSYEWGMTTYDGEVMVGWNSLGEEPTDNNNAVSMYIPFDKLFFNCPSTLSRYLIMSLFNTYEEVYDEMEGEHVLIANYCGKVISFYVDQELTSSSKAFINVMTDYENPNIESIQIKNSDDEPVAPTKNSSAYYDYAVAHDGEFWDINKDWTDDKNYYYLVDVDHDGQKEMVVKIGCGVGIYKEINGVVEEVFYDNLPDSSGSVNYWVATYDNHDYIVYSSASSSEYLVLNKLTSDRLSEVRKSMVINYTDYTINDKTVTKAEYTKYVKAIDYLQGITIEGLK